MISIDEARTLKFFFMGMFKSNQVLLPTPVLEPLRSLVVYHLAYELITVKNDVFTNLLEYLTYRPDIQLDDLNQKQLVKLGCYALDLSVLFHETEFSSLKYRSNYLLKEEHISDYFNKVSILMNSVNDNFSAIDIAKYISTGKQWLNKRAT